jgi:peptidoglycan/xylan/chitin deacetylase (PgdA/CDA1 family)
MLYISHPPTYLPERRYIFGVLLREFLGLDYQAGTWASQEVCLTWQDASGNKRLTLPDTLFQTPKTDWLTTNALPEQPLKTWNLPDALADIRVISPSLPVIYGRSPGGDSTVGYQEHENGAVLGLDVFGSAFFMLTRYEELVKPERDQHDRFPARASLAFQEGFLERPIINEYLEVLWGVIQRLWPGLQRKRRSYRVFLSHDVDIPLCTQGRNPAWVLRSAGADIVLRRDMSLALRRLRAYTESWRGFFEHDPCNTFDSIMDLSERHGRQSAFYFICGRSPDLVNQYELDSPWIRGLLRRIHQRGHEIGLHSSYDTYRDALRTRQEFQKLRVVAAAEDTWQREWGGRQHYLRWENPTTWQNWEDARLDYDSTLGFADQPGFRCGICYEYPVFNLRTRQSLALRERPLVVMDGTLLDYLKLSLDASAQRILALAAVCRQFAGDMALLWHNDNLLSQRQRHLYQRVCRGL